MPEQPVRKPAGAVRDRGRFDGESARRILQRAAAEQQRLIRELDDSYSVEELEEIAAEAGISPEALRAAVESEKGASGNVPFRGTPAPAGTPRDRRTEVRGLLPARFRSGKGVALITVGGIALLGSLLAFPAFAEAVFWVLMLLLIAVAVLILLGASPF